MTERCAVCGGGRLFHFFKDHDFITAEQLSASVAQHLHNRIAARRVMERYAPAMRVLAQDHIEPEVIDGGDVFIESPVTQQILDDSTSMLAQQMINSAVDTFDTAQQTYDPTPTVDCTPVADTGTSSCDTSSYDSSSSSTDFGGFGGGGDSGGGSSGSY